MSNLQEKYIAFIKIKYKLIVFILFTLILCATVFYLTYTWLNDKPETEVITQSSLEKIINVSELSTFEAVYVGVAKVMNETKPEDIDYYVYYESKVKAGIDFEKVLIQINHETKKITITLPNITITDINVDIASLDYMFENNKANTETVSEQAYKACIADVSEESSNEDAIFELARQNAENIMTALISPFIEQLDEEYFLEIV